MTRPVLLGSIDTATRRLRRSLNRRRCTGLRPWLQVLEDRTLLSVITWNNTAAPNGGNWDTGGNWQGGVAPGPNDSAVIDLTTAATVTVSSTGDSVESITTNSDTTFAVTGSLNLGSGSTTFDGPVNISATGSLTVASGATILVSDYSTLTNDGALSFGSGDVVTLGTNGYYAVVADNGTMTATNTTFTATSANSNVAVNSGGTFTPSGSTFNLTLYVPITQVQNLTNNISFQEIEIDSGTLSGSTVDLNLIGTNDNNLKYVFSSDFTISSTGVLNVGANVPVLLTDYAVVTNNGALSFSSGDVVTFGTNGYYATLADNGSMTATSTTFAATNSNSNIAVNNGGTISPTGSIFNLALYVPILQVQNLTNNTSFEQIQIDAGTLSGTTVDLNSIGTNTTNLEYVFSSNFTISSTGVLNVGANVPVLLTDYAILTNNGALSFSSGDVVTFGTNGYYATLADNGSMTATGTTFAATNSNSNIAVNNGGTISPTGSIFNLALYVPILQVQNLTNNTSFEQIQIDTGTLSGTTVDLNLIGTNTANLEYVFSSNFTIAATGVLNIGANVPVLLTDYAILTNNGNVGFSSGDVVTFGANGYYATLADNGDMTATGTTFSATNSNSNIAVNNDGTISPTGSIFNLALYVPILQVQNLTNNTSFEQIQIDAGTLSGTTVDLDSIGTNTTNLEYVFSSNFTIAATGVLNIGANVPVLLTDYAILTNNGNLGFSSGDVVTFGANGYYATLADNGDMTATGTTFSATSSNSNIAVSSVGTISPASSIFNLALYVPYNDITNLTNNESFEQIEIDAGTLSNSTLNLDLIGTNTTNLSYVFSANFTVASSGVLNVGPNVPVLITDYSTLTDDGMMSLASGDSLTLGANGYYGLIAVGGSLAITGTTVTGPNSSTITVNSGGVFTASDTSFGMKQLILGSGSNDTLHFTTFTGQISINSGATINISGNDFSTVGNGGVIAAGVSTAKIDLEENYWGSTDSTTIEKLIDDNHVNSSLPTILFEPVWASNSGPIASPASVLFSSSDQTVPLTAVVSTTSGIPITGGTVTFTILNGDLTVGQPTSPEPVSQGTVSADYTLPGGTAVGSYVIQASFSGNGVYPASTDSSQFLTVSPAATQVAITSAPLALVAGGDGQVTVELEDSNGDPAISTSAQTIGLSTTSTAGVFDATQNGTPITSIVIPAGQSSASFYYTDTRAGTPTLTASDSALSSAPTQLETVNPAAVSTFTVTTSLASPDTAGTVGTVTVTAMDQYSNVVSSGPNQYEGTVHMSSSDSRQAGLPTSYAFTAADAGSHTFSNVILKTAGSQTITATDSGNSMITGNVAVTVVPAPASLLVITTPALNLVAGNRGAVTVQIEDAYGNPATSSSAQTINLSTTSTAGAFYATQNSTAPISSVVIPVGQSSASFYYGDTIAGTPTVTVADNNVGPATTQQETITPAAASKVAITSPPLTIAAGSRGQITVQLEDTYGNPGAVSNSSQTISLSTTSTTGAFYTTQGGTTPITSVVIAAGSNSASFYYGDSTDGMPTVTVADSAFNSSSSQVETITSAKASKVVITSTALSLIAGNRGSVTVQLEDVNGNPATSTSAQTIALVTTSADGVFYATQNSSTPITSIVIPAGQSSGSFYYGDTKAGTPTVKASDIAFSPPSTSTQVETVYPAVAESFTITTSFADPDPAGTEGTVTVSALDTYNNVVGSGPDQYLGTVNLSSTDSQVTGLPPSYTFTVADAGSHTFTNVALEIAGKQTFTATDSVTSTITGTSGQVNVVPVKAAAIHITTRPPGGVIAGKNFSITVNADDPYGNLDTSFNGMVSVALANGSSGTLTGTLTMMATAGVAVFGNLADTTSGSISINATSANLTGDTASNIPVNPAPANHFVVTTSFASQDVAGTVGTVTVAEADPFGNIESSGPNQYLGTVNLFSTDSRETGLPASYTFTAGDAGSHTFAGVILKTAGNQTITATDSGDSTITGSVSVLVIPAPASQVVITSSALNLIAGGRGSVAFQLEDAYDNMGAVSTSAQTINLSTTSTAGAFFATESGTSPITSVVIPVGQSSASFYYSDTKAGTPTVTTADSGLSSSPTQLETVNPAPVNDFVVTTSFANPDVAGTTGTVTVTAEDQYTNIVGSGPNLYLGSVELSNTDTKATGLPASYTFTAGDAGSHTFDNVVLKTAGTQTITATDSITHAITGNITVDVVPAKVLDLAVTTSFTNPDVAGTVGTVTVTAQDAFSNPVSSGPNQYTGTVDLTSTDVLAAGLPASFTITDIDAGSHTFNNVILKTAGTQTITATDSAINTITGSAMVIVVPAAGDQMVITSPPRTLVAGARGQILVEFEDTYHNLGASSTSAQTVNLGTTSAAGVFYATQSSNTPITSFVISVGQTGASVYYSDTKTGTPTVTTSDSAFRSSPTQMESENPAIVHDFVVTTSFPNPDVAGTTGNVTVTAKDQYGNTVGSGPNEYEGTVKLVSTDGQAAGVPASLIFTVADGGSTTLPGVVLKTAGPETITAADSVTTTISGSATIDVTAATVTHLVVTTPPPNPIVPGQPFSVGISAEDAFGNVASSFNEGVTISLGNDPAFTTTLQPTNGVAMFTGLTASAADQGSAITAVASGLPPIMTPPIPISPTPTIVHDQVLTMQKTNNKGKKVGKPVFEGFTFVFSGAMNPTTAGANADYHVDYKVITRGKKKSATKYNPVSFRPSYNPATNTVTLFVKSTKPFAKGGQITISGVTDQAGTALDASDTVFAITPNAKTITRG